MTIELVLAALNEWDPIGLKYIAPPDEYSGEAKNILKLIENNKGSFDTLVSSVYDIMIDSFGDFNNNITLYECGAFVEKLIFKDMT
jgi:hypothetical protein